MDEAGHAAAGSAQADDVDTQIQQGSQERGSWGPNVVQNLKEEENVIVTRCPGARCVHLASGAGDLAPNTVVWYLESRVAWNLSSHMKEERGTLLFGMDGTWRAACGGPQ